MFSNSNDPRELLRMLFKNYKLSSYSLSKITGIKDEIILNYANGKDDLSSLPIKNKMDLVDLIMLLTLGMEAADENERIYAVIETITSKFNLSIETIALYANLDCEEIKNFLNDHTSISIEKRYKLGITVLFLHYICKQG